MSTIGAEDAAFAAESLGELAAESIGELGHPMLAAPVSGSVPGAEAGTLALRVGGEARVVEEYRG